MIFLVSLAPNITVVSSDRRFRQPVRVVICYLQSQSKFSTPAVGGIQIFVFNLVNQLVGMLTVVCQLSPMLLAVKM